MALRTLTGEKLEAERARLALMREYEDTYAACTAICGIDEAGRGPLAGPVVAGAAILPVDCEILFLNDSKKLSEKKRDLLFDEIKEKAVAYGIGIVSPQVIDEINILQATYRAMKQAVDGLTRPADFVYVDGNRSQGLEQPHECVVSGDAKIPSVAAASIIAKVTRDRLMRQFAEQYPQYGFAVHKGYGTKRHYEALREFGPSPIHRKTFLKKFYENP